MRELTKGKKVSADFVFGVCCAALLSESSIFLTRYIEGIIDQRNNRNTPPRDSWYIVYSSTKRRGTTTMIVKQTNKKQRADLSLA